MKEQLLEHVLTSQRLPSLPTVALEVIGLVQRPNVNLNQIAETIQNDPALATKILKTVNSSFYGLSEPVSTISHALVVLGLNSVKTLALGFALTRNLSLVGGDGFDHVMFWRRSLYAAAAAKILARQVGLVQQEEAFLGGLLQDLGMLALHEVLGESYGKLLEQARRENKPVTELEQEALQMDHAELGAALAESWHLPALLVTPIRYHEDPDESPEDLRALVRCVALGDLASQVFIEDPPGEGMAAYLACGQMWFGLDHDAAQPLLKEIHTETCAMGRLLDLPGGELPNADAILAQANEALGQITLQIERQTSELQRENSLLNEQAHIDSLTDAANRRRFNEFTASSFAAANDKGLPLSLLFLDTDHFKEFNDSHGHQTGDRILIEISTILRQSVGPRALVARYGGEEFVVVLPETSRRDAAMLAEDIRQRIAERRIQSDAGQELSITVSIGVSTLVNGCFRCVDHLVKAADQAVYAAKNAGRNSVRVFAPKPKVAT